MRVRSKISVLILIPLILISAIFINLSSFSQEPQISAEDLIKKVIEHIDPEHKLEKIGGLQRAAFIYDNRGNLYCSYSVTFKRPDYLEERFSFGKNKNNITSYDKGQVSIVESGKEVDDAGRLKQAKDDMLETIEKLPVFFYNLFLKKVSYNLKKDKEKVKDVNCYVVGFSVKEDYEVVFYIDENSLLPLAVVDVIVQPDGSVTRKASLCVKYKKFDGIYMPSLIEKFENKRKVISAEINSIKWIYDAQMSADYNTR